MAHWYIARSIQINGFVDFSFLILVSSFTINGSCGYSIFDVDMKYLLLIVFLEVSCAAPTLRVLLHAGRDFIDPHSFLNGLSLLSEQPKKLTNEENEWLKRIRVNTHFTNKRRLVSV